MWSFFVALIHWAFNSTGLANNEIESSPCGTAKYEDNLRQPTTMKRKSKPKTDTLFQLKITLLDIKPPIWRRIQIRDCTLDALHDVLQVVMGWENCHLHRFDINGQAFGDPDLFEEDFLEFDMRDSRKTMLSQIVPKDGKRAGSSMNTILVTAGGTKSCLREIPRSSRVSSIRPAWKANGVAHQKMSAVQGATKNTWRQLPTQATRTTRISCNGEESSIQSRLI